VVEEGQLEFGWKAGVKYEEFTQSLRSFETFLRNEEDDIRYWNSLSDKLKKIKREYESLMGTLEKIPEPQPEPVKNGVGVLEHRLSRVRSIIDSKKEREVYLKSLFSNEPELGEFYAFERS
jgi:hypothetical protein